jgi:TfoX/Sxy family transcriptional regulator of competence genes
MSQTTVTPEEHCAAIVETLLRSVAVTLGSPGRKGFGSSGLWCHGRIFAMLSDGRLVVKLPRQRVDALVAAEAGERFDPRHDGRLMKEWLTVEPTSEEGWLPLAKEAMEFVASKR